MRYNIFMKYVPVSKRRLHKRILIFSIVFVAVVAISVAAFFIVRAINVPQRSEENSYKYGFIDRYPEEWAGGSMTQPLNVDENGSTGYYETWHYRYVGNPAATEIATGKYNDGKYDSLEHYLKASGRLKNLISGSCL